MSAREYDLLVAGGGGAGLAAALTGASRGTSNGRALIFGYVGADHALKA